MQFKVTQTYKGHHFKTAVRWNLDEGSKHSNTYKNNIMAVNFEKKDKINGIK